MKRGLDNEGNVTDMKERETNEERQTRLVNLRRHLHISVMALHINWLGKERIIELDVQSSEKGQEREPLQSPLVLLYSCSISCHCNLCYNTLITTHTIYKHM